jgi:hypothetical protein
MSKDEKGEFCGLVRICDKASGRVIWMSEESKEKLEAEEEDALSRGGGGGGGGADSAPGRESQAEGGATHRRVLRESFEAQGRSAARESFETRG